MQVKKEVHLSAPHVQKKPIVAVLKPLRKILTGNHAILGALNTKAHAYALFELISIENQHNPQIYFSNHLIETYHHFKHWLDKTLISDKTFFYTILDLRTHSPFGFVSFKNIAAEHSVIECTHAYISPLYHKTQAVTEAMYLLMNHLFEELNYQHYEWKCNRLDKYSCAEAERLGFKRDTVHTDAHSQKLTYFIHQEDWTMLKDKYIKWLEPTNFDHNGRQIFTLLEI